MGYPEEPTPSTNPPPTPPPQAPPYPAMPPQAPAAETAPYPAMPPQTPASEAAPTQPQMGMEPPAQPPMVSRTRQMLPRWLLISGASLAVGGAAIGMLVILGFNLGARG